MRKVFLEDLPRYRIGKGKPQGDIDWKVSIGYRVRFIYNDIEGEIEIMKYETNGGVLYVNYLDKKMCKIYITTLKNCNLGILLGEITSEFRISIGTIFKDNGRDLVITDKEYRVDKYHGNKKYYKYTCNKCGYENGWIEEHNLIKGKNNCSVCCPAPKKVEEGINDLATTAPWMIPYFLNPNDTKLYTYQSNKMIQAICPECGMVRIKDISINNIHRTHSIGCLCGDGFSYGHKYIHSILSQMKFEFEYNHRFDWCIFPSYKNNKKQVIGEYDFVLENDKIIIEVDGSFHRKDNNMSGQTKEESDYLDCIKNSKAIEHGYRVIRIIADVGEFKDNVLNSEMNTTFNLSVIDWNKAESFALSNRVKEACSYKKDNANITTSEIGVLMDVDGQTIRKYLKKGNKLGWCHYSAKEECKKCGIRVGEIERLRNSRKVEMFKDNESLGVFESTMYLEKNGEKLFGVKLGHGNISQVCNNIRLTHKGFTFKYIDQDNTNSTTPQPTPLLYLPLPKIPKSSKQPITIAS